MNLPSDGDYIDIHNHGGRSRRGIFSVENLLANEERAPDDEPGLTFTTGIHPWHLERELYNVHLERVEKDTLHHNVIAVGEAGFDKLRGPSAEFQREAFEAQAAISESRGKPLFIHCVRAWDELLLSHKRVRPAMPWLIHGFRGRKELARQLTDKGMYISFWFEFIVRPDSAELVRSIPAGRIFLETDGSGIGIEKVYRKVAGDLGITQDELKERILMNYRQFLRIQ